MKKLIIIFLLIANSVSAQWLNSSTSGTVNLGFPGLSKAGGSTYSERAKLFFARVTLTDAQKQFYNDYLFRPLIDSGLIHATDPLGDSLEVFYWFAISESGTDCDTNVIFKNILQDAYNGISYGGVTITDSGVVGGTNKWITSQFNASADSSIYKLNSASIGYYSKTENTATVSDMGGHDGTNITDLTADYSGLTYYRVNCIIGVNPQVVSTVSMGSFLVSRVKSNISNLYRNSALLASGTQVSTAIPNYTIVLLANNNNGTLAAYSSRVISSAFIGSGLSADKSRKLSNIINEALRVFGYNVY